MHEAKIQIEDAKKQNRKYEEKIKEMTTSNNNEKAKRNDEIKKLKMQIKSLKDEAASTKNLNLVSDDEISQKAQIIADKMAQEINIKVSKERSELLNQIENLKKSLESAREEMENRESDFEKEKIQLKNQIIEDNNTDEIIQGM